MSKWLFMLLLAFSLSCTAQDVTIATGYNYLYARQWDKAIQTYNFGRPYLSNKQPLLMHGWYGSMGLIFRSNKNIRHGIHVSYSYFRSQSENENFNSLFNLYFIDPAYTLNYQKPGKRYFYGGSASVLMAGLFRSINQQPLIRDEKRVKAFGIGGALSLRAGYELINKNKNSLSPFFEIKYAPCFNSPNFEAVLNQTKGLSGKKKTGMVSLNAGIILRMKKEAASATQ